VLKSDCSVWILEAGKLVDKLPCRPLQPDDVAQQHLNTSIGLGAMADPDTTPRRSCDVEYRPFRSEEHDLPDIMDLVDQELSEP
jgi:hypothetical protein